MASLINAVVAHGASYIRSDDTIEVPCCETDVPLEYVYVDMEEAMRVMERRRQKVKFTNSNYLADFAKKHLHLLALGLDAGLLGPDSPLRPDAAGSTLVLDANHAHGRLEYTGDGLKEFPDKPNLRINFVRHGTAKKHGRGHLDSTGPYLVRKPYSLAGPRPRESGKDIHIDSFRGGSVEVPRHALNAALHYHCQRVSQPRTSVLVSDGGLTGYEPPKYARSGDVMYGTREISGVCDRKISDIVSPKNLQTALDRAGRGAMIVIENPERYVDDMDSFIQMLFEKTNWGLYMLVVTEDQTLAERVASIRRESGGLDAEYAEVYRFEPENGGHTITEW